MNGRKKISPSAHVGILGGINVLPGSKAWSTAEEVGERIAKENLVLVTGAAMGVSAAAGKAALRGGGVVVGILPVEQYLDEPPKLDTSALTILVRTGLPPKARNVVTISSCKAVIAISGGYGTLNEMTIAVAQNTPLIVIEGCGGATDLMRGIVEALGHKQLVTFAADAEEAVEKVLKVIAEGEKNE